MTYAIPVFRVDSAADALKRQTLWTGPEFAKATGCSEKAACKRLNKLKKAGLVVRLGTSGPSSRWCHADNEQVARAEILELQREVAVRRVEAVRRRAQNARVARAAKRKANRAANRPPKPAKVCQQKLPPTPAFTIPPRGVPCSVWALAAAGLIERSNA